RHRQQSELNSNFNQSPYDARENDQRKRTRDDPISQGQNESKLTHHPATQNKRLNTRAQ
ncbi:Hypothetical predicted protein, partial [Pelobates cultripes]